MDVGLAVAVGAEPALDLLEVMTACRLIGQRKIMHATLDPHERDVSSEVGCPGSQCVDVEDDVPEKAQVMRVLLMELNRARSTSARLKALSKFRPRDLAPNAPGTGEPRTGLSMGDHQAITTKAWNITREAQDELAARSHHNLARSYDEGFQDDLVTAFRGVERDNNMRPDSSVEKLATLKPVFGRGAAATMTAGNSTPLSACDWSKLFRRFSLFLSGGSPFLIEGCKSC